MPSVAAWLVFAAAAIAYWQWQMRISHRRTEAWMWIVAGAAIVAGALLVSSSSL